MFHRQYMHKMLLNTATQEEGEGVPIKLIVNHKVRSIPPQMFIKSQTTDEPSQCQSIDLEAGTITFDNGVRKTHQVIVGADGIGSAVRNIIGIQVEKRPADSSCLHANVSTEQVRKLGLTDYSLNSALEYWGGHETKNKIVLSPCNGGSLLSYYCFFPRDKGDYAEANWNAEASVEELLAPYPDLDKQVKDHLAIGVEVKPWRLWVHQPYSHWQRGVACIMGDAAHPMMPDQSQGACMAIEDAACLGLVFSKKHFNGDIKEALQVFEKVRKPRATRVQAASARARENISERIGKF